MTKRHLRTTALRIERELYERIEVLGDRLRASAEEERVAIIIASVSRLDGAPDANGRMAGEVQLSPVFPTGLRRLSARLSPEQYEVASQAHLKNALVSAAGTLGRVGRTRVLKPTEFSLVPTD